jgi:hypothetical protein
MKKVCRAFEFPIILTMTTDADQRGQLFEHELAGEIAHLGLPKAKL